MQVFQFSRLALVIGILYTSLLSAQKRTLPVDTMVITNHTTTIKGAKVTYQADTGTQPVWDENGNPIASLFYTYYRRTNEKRPRHEQIQELHFSILR